MIKCRSFLLMSRRLQNNPMRSKLILPLLLLLVLLVSTITAQRADNWENTTYTTYLTPQVGLYDQNFVRVEQELVEAYVIMQVALQTNGSLFNGQIRMGFGWNKQRFRAYFYLPYLNHSFNERKYNTPFSAEVFWKPCKKAPEMTACFDLYKNTLSPAVRVKFQLHSFVEKSTVKWKK